MADHWQAAPPGPTPRPGERWNVNLPAVVGVVFVFLLGVVIWVVVASAGDGDGETSGTDVTTPSSPTTTLQGGVAPTTSPLPMPITTPPPSATVAPTSPPTSEATVAPTSPATAPPGATSPMPTAPPESGDLGVPGHPMQRPPCDDHYITVLGSAIGDQATPESMAAVLDDHPGSYYLRTDRTCPSLTQEQNGQPIYVVFFGPFVVASDACAARADGPNGAYVRQLSDDLPPSHSVSC